MNLPNLEPKSMDIDVDYVNRLLGLALKGGEIKNLLEKMRFGVQVEGKTLKVEIPPYRTDVLHPIDIVEDVAIAYRYDRFNPELPPLNTVGSKIQRDGVIDDIRQLMIGLGFQEVMTLTMTNPHELFEKMGVSFEEVVEAKNPVSAEHSIARTWLLPSLMGVLEKNRNREYPQKVFESGICVSADGGTRHALSGVMAKAKSDFAEIKSNVASILESLDLTEKPERLDKKTFILGRAAKNQYGFYGEIAPNILSNFGLEVPVTGFELDVKNILADIE
ncbi:MAG: hypothetical protein ABH950_00550 [Candidatus Altiarchaeota archaeon]